MAATKGSLGMPVIALKKPHYKAELLNFALHHDCALVMSVQTSKNFICYQIVHELFQNESEKLAVILTDDNSGIEMAPLIKIFNQLLPRKPIVFPDLNKAALLAHEENQDVILMSTSNFQQCLTKGYMYANNISVVIILTTLKTIAIDHPTILTLSKEDIKPRIIGLVEIDLHDIHTPSYLKSQLENLETLYNLPIFMSKDVLAMNAFGEEIVVETVPYSSKNLSLIERNVWKVLNEISDFLQDINITQICKSVQKVRAIVLWALEVLIIFGLWSFKFILERIQNTLSVMLNKENNMFVSLAIEASRTQFDLVQKLINTQSSPIYSSLMNEMFEKLKPYHVLCNTSTAEQGFEIDEHEVDVSGEQRSCVTENQTKQHTEEDNLSDKRSVYESKEETAYSETFLDKESISNNDSLYEPKILEKRLHKLKKKSKFYCIIVTRSNSFAKMLSKLINYMSACNAKYSFMKSGCVVQSKNGSHAEEERTEKVLQAVLQGMVNIIVTTVDLYSDLYLITFNVLVYFGTPSSYKEYFEIKHKIKGLAPKLMLVFNDHHLEEMERNLQVFFDIESEIAKRVSCYITQENKESWLKHLAEEPPCVYTPFGENGPSVSMESSIHLVNQYCRRINRGDFLDLYAQFITQKKDLTENCVEFVSKLYLPLSSSCCSVVEGPVVQVNKGSDEDVGKLKSQMLAALECVKILHNCGKMDDDLELIEEQYVDESTESAELENETKGRAGTNKRKRAYEIKTPSVFEDNMPRANEICFLYKILFEDPTVYKHSRSGSLASLCEPEIELGLLSKKPLPKMPSFLVHTCKSDVNVSLEASDPIKIDARTLTSIKLFHHYIFRELYRMDNQLTALSETDGYLAVPLVPNTSHLPSPPPTTTISTKPPAQPPSSLQSPSTTGPRNSCQIHVDFLQEFSTFFETPTDPVNVKWNVTFTDVDFSFFQNKIVRRINESANQSHTRYFVVKVCHDLSPLSPFPDEDVAATFAEYYENRYGIHVKLEQPLLLVQYLPTQMSFNFQRQRQQTTEDLGVSSKSSRAEVHLIPELCSILPLSASAWSLARYLPTIVYRLEAMLRAHEMRLKILFAAGITKNMGDLGAEGKYTNGKLESCDADVGERGNVVGEGFDSAGGGNGDNGDGITSIGDGDEGNSNDDEGDGNDRNGDYGNGNTNIGDAGVNDGATNGDYSNGNTIIGDGDDGATNGDYSNGNTSIGKGDGQDDVGPSISLILHALTAKSAGQQFHSEQLEVLGDTCLKLEVSLELFLTDPGKDEWVLSIYRKHLVSNDMLSRQGRRVGIPGYISITLPDLNNTSIPPGFIFEPSQGVKKKTSLDLYTHQVLGDKNVANTVEALIAATLLGCGRHAVRQFLIWLGLAKSTSSELYALCQHTVQTTGQDVNCVMSEKRETMPAKNKQRDGNLSPWYVKDNLDNVTMFLQAHSTGENCYDAISEERGTNVQAEDCRSDNVEENLNETKSYHDCLTCHEQLGKEHQNLNHNLLERKEREMSKRLVSNECNGSLTLKTIYNQSQITEQKHDCKPRISDNLIGGKEDSEISLKNSTPLKNKSNVTSKSHHQKRPVPNFNHIERELGYSFKNKHLLLQALTHNSYPRFLSQSSETYQRMEFIGDAILDYIVTLYLYEKFPHLTHGDMTDFRSGLVNNFTLAFLAVQNNMHQFLRHMSPNLLDVVAQFIKFLEDQEFKQGASWKTSIDAVVVGASEMNESLVEVPKVLGDVFEAVVCAIYLDSGMDLELVWKIVLPMLMPFIDYYKENIPRSPIRVLKESFPDCYQINFSLARLTLSRQYKSSVVIAGYGKFEAIGRTPKIAKASVARKALQHIRNEGATTL